jgi:molecular chaperone GrpE
VNHPTPSADGATDEVAPSATPSPVVEIEIVEPGSPTTGLDEIVSALPESADDALDQLRASREEIVDLRDRLQRMTADFDNYRKRVERDQLRIVTSASERVVKELLPTLDAFDAALGYSPTTEREANLLNGMASTHAQLLDTLAKEGLEPTPGAGVPFDPTIHEAVTGPTDGNGDLVVTQELRRGYTMHGKVVRPALVAVDNN